jgi:hypothetical protein
MSYLGILYIFVGIGFGIYHIKVYDKEAPINEEVAARGNNGQH